MKPKELRAYESVIKQGLSVREAEQIFNLPVSTTYRRLQKCKSLGSLIHGNTGHQNRKLPEDKEQILYLIKNKYDFGFSYSHLSELLKAREVILTMHEKPIRYFVGDPAFLLPVLTWVECCEVFDKYDEEVIYGKFKETVAKALTDFTGYEAYVSEIGPKMWVNAISGEGVLKSNFISSSGFVCVSRKRN